MPSFCTLPNPDQAQRLVPPHPAERIADLGELTGPGSAAVSDRAFAGFEAFCLVRAARPVGRQISPNVAKGEPIGLACRSAFPWCAGGRRKRGRSNERVARTPTAG